MDGDRTCAVCSDNFIVSSKQISCKFCKKYFHPICVKVKDNFSRFISECGNVFWFCDGCCTLVESNLNLLARLNCIEQKTEDVLKQTNECINMVKQIGTQSIHENPSWSEIVKSKKPPLIIKPKNTSQNCNVTKADIAARISPSEININRITNAAQGSIRIECETEESMQKLHEAAKNVLSNEYEIKMPELKKPKVIIVGVTDEYLADSDEFVNKVKNINIGLDVKFVKKFKARRGPYFNVILETSAESFNYFVAQGRIRFGWDSFPVYEFVSVLRCFKCCKYGHVANECRQESCTCPQCGGSHKGGECTSLTKCCSNCKHMATVLKIPNILYDHAVFDRNCTSYRKQLEKSKSRIKYV